MGSRGQQRHGTHLSDQAGVSPLSKHPLLFPKDGKDVGFMFSIHLCEVSRESAQEDHPSGAGRSVRTQEEEPHAALVCVTQGSDSGRLGLRLHSNCEALEKRPRKSCFLGAKGCDGSYRQGRMT